MSIVARAIREYGSAFRGDWLGIDGREVRCDMELIASALDGGAAADWNIQKWRVRLGMCPDGEGHWVHHCETPDGCSNDAEVQS